MGNVSGADSEADAAIEPVDMVCLIFVLWFLRDCLQKAEAFFRFFTCHNLDS